MKIKTVNVVESFYEEVSQIIAFSGENAMKEAEDTFKALIVEFNDPRYNCDENRFEGKTFKEKELNQLVESGSWTDGYGYHVRLVESSS